MGMFCPRSRGGKRLQRRSRSERGLGTRLASFFLCLSTVAGFFPALARAVDGVEYLSSIVDFQSITLHYADENGYPIEPPIQTGQDKKTLLDEDGQLVLKYTYAITEEQCKQIQAGEAYYLEVSPHLALPDLKAGAPLILKGETEPFGYIYADGSRAWVEFLADEVNDGLLLGSDGIQDADFYLDCTRADAVPKDELPIGGQRNLYAMKVEKREILQFGYAEDEPVTAKAQIKKTGAYQDKIITWTIGYTPWQNPSEDSDVALDTPFELQDTIKTDLHEYVQDSAAITIDGKPVQNITCYTSGDAIDRDQDAYVIVDTPEGGDTTLTFGGRIFNAAESTAGNPAPPLNITYQTEIKDELLLPGGAGGGKVTNAADLLAGKNGIFNRLNITDRSTVIVPQPEWLTKRGQTTRTPGSGSATDWTVTFYPNGFTFGADAQLTLRDQLPKGSELDASSVAAKADGKTIQGITVTPGEDNAFTVSGIETAGQTVEITYRTHVPEDMYDAGEDLGKNIVQFTFHYGEKDYHTPSVSTSVDSGNGTSGTATLLKSNTGYQPASRTIDWTVTINPHKANLKSGTFTDDLSQIGPACGIDGHIRGLELDQTKGIEVLVDGAAVTDGSVAAAYSDQERKITVETRDVGRHTVTLAYTTKVCDPCIFANNAKASLTNTISTNNMSIGSQSDLQRSADSTANVSATVLNKKAPVYDYTTGLMKWTVEVDAAGLPMTDVVLTDDLPDGLSYKESTLATHTADGRAIDAAAAVDGQRLTIRLDSVTEKTTVTFDTKVDPETLGFNSNEKIVWVENTICMNGAADGVEFADVFHSVRQNFSNHGLVKSSKVDNQQELIQYEVLINPYGLALPENPSLVDTLDRRLQLDTDTLLFYEAALTGTTNNPEQKPGYTKPSKGQPLKIADFDPAANSFTVQLPIRDGSRGAYVLTYTADIIDHQAGGYSNSVHFSGGDLLLGGDKNNSASVGGGGGGGGGGVAARKAVISIVKTDSETQKALAGVSFTLYQWDEDKDTRGLPFAQGETDAGGALTFKVKPNAVYELVETESLPGYGSAFAVTNPPDGVTETEGGLLITAGEAKSVLALELTNEAHTTDIVFRVVNQSGIPVAGGRVKIFAVAPDGQTDWAPLKEAVVSFDGSVRLPGIRRGARYHIQRPDGGIMPVEVPVQTDGEPKVTLPDGTQEILTENYLAQSTTQPEQQWTLTVKKVIGGGAVPLAGAEIGLYADKDCRTLIASGESVQDGTVTFSGLIKGQSYWLKEITAPSGYQLDAKIYEAVEGTSDIAIENMPVVSSNPDTSGGSGSSSGPDLPGGSGSSSGPDLPGASGNPSGPDISDGSGGLESPGSFDNLGDSGVPGDTIEAPDGPSTGGPNIPQTGDYTQLLIAMTLLFGIVLAAMVLYRTLEQTEREKK